MPQVYSAVCLWRQDEKIVLYNSPRPLTMLCRVDQAGHVAIWMLVFVHQLVGVAYFVEAKDVGQSEERLRRFQRRYGWVQLTAPSCSFNAFSCRSSR